MNFQEMYRQKLTTPEEAVKVIRSGDWVDYGWSTGTPDVLDKALAARAEELTNVKIRGAILLRRPAIADVPNAKDHFIYNSWHSSAIERQMVKEGMAYYDPMRFSEIPSYYRDCLPPVDVAMIQVTPMDEHGWFNFGPSATHEAAMLEKAKCIIVEVNPNQPYCYGGFDCGIRIDDVDMIVEAHDSPMGKLVVSAEPGDTEWAIARQVVEEIPNGACMQLGIGVLPTAVGRLIADSDLKDLGVQTEMYVDAFVDMALAGRITGKRKNYDKGRQTYSFASGSQKLYDYLDHNPECMSAPIDYVNNITNVAAQDNFISINGAVDMDLFGQVSSESSGTRHISGSGGQQDFVMGAYLSKGGKSFICFNSTVKDKKTGELKSRIRPTLVPGSVTTCTRTNTHYVVTEYGKVNLKGLTTWERAEAMISIAHPDFREELIREAEKMGIWSKANKMMY